MRNLIVVLVCFLALQVEATTYYVLPTGDNSHAGTSWATAFLTIQKAASTAVAGDIVYVGAGTYNEQITCSTTGTAGNLITFVATNNASLMNGFGNSICRGFIIGSGSALSPVNYIQIIGFEITHVNLTFTDAIMTKYSTDHIYLIDNYIHNTHSTHSGIFSSFGYNAVPTYIFIRGNILDSIGIIPGVYTNTAAPGGIANVFVTPNHWLVEYNQISKTGDFTDIYGTNIIQRNGWYHNFRNSYFNCDDTVHQDGFQPGSDGVIAGSRYHIYEAMFEGDSTELNSHFGLWQDTMGAGDTNIMIRGCIGYNLGSSGPSSISTKRFLLFNSTLFSTCNHAGNGSGTAWTDYKKSTGPAAGDYPSNMMCANVIIAYNGDYTHPAIFIQYTNGFVITNHNIGFHAGTDASYISTADPSFVSTNALDFHLKSDSPGKGTGTNLIWITSASSSGTTFNVNDGLLLCDGWGMCEGDIVTIGGVTTHVTTITGNAITVNNIVTWTVNDPVYLGPYSSVDIGALPYASADLTNAVLTRNGDLYTVTTFPATAAIRKVWFYKDGIPDTQVTSAPFTANYSSGVITAKAYPLYAQIPPEVIVGGSPGTNLTLSISPNPAYVGDTITYNGQMNTNNVIDIGATPSYITYNFDCLAGQHSSSLVAGTYTFQYASTAAGTPGGVYSVATYGGIVYTSNVVPLTILLRPTTNSLMTSSLNPSVSGNAVTFTYTLKTNSPPTSILVPNTPTDATGTMKIFSDGVQLVSGSPASGVKTVTTSALAIGTHTITGTYSGDSKYATNFFTGLFQVVNSGAAIPTTTTITAYPNPSIKPQNVTVTSSVLNSGTGLLASDATGSIAFIVNSTTITNISVSAGVSTFALTTLPTVNDIITATYTGDSKYNGSTSTNYLQLNFNGVQYLSAVNNAQYYIGTAATGLFISNGKRGTPTTPLDGSTYINFDANMNSLPAGKIINILAGTYQTKGVSGWIPKQGQMILGAGKTSTILQFPASLINNGTIQNIFMIRANPTSANIDIENLTIDGNYQAGITPCTLKGIELFNGTNTLRHIILKNLASFTPVYIENFAVLLNGVPVTGPSYDNIFDDITVTNYMSDHNNNMSAISMVYAINSQIVNCSIYQRDPTNKIFGYNVAGIGILVSNCFGYGVTTFTYNDTQSGGTNITFANNFATNCTSFAVFTSGHYQDIYITNNSGMLSRGVPGDNGTLFLWSPPYGVVSPMTFNHVEILTNSFNSTGKTNAIVNMYLGTNVIFGMNTFFTNSTPHLITNFVNCATLTITNNRNFSAQSWP